MTTDPSDRVIFRHELQELMHVTSESVRRWMVAGRLPKPDVAISRKTLGWRLSTLRAAGINIA
jgi:hypothetical protein